MSAANKNGYFSAELVEMELKTKKGKEVFSQDEHPRETTIDKLAKLKPVFKEDGMVTAGNASVSRQLTTICLLENTVTQTSTPPPSSICPTNSWHYNNDTLHTHSSSQTIQTIAIKHLVHKPCFHNSNVMLSSGLQYTKVEG